MILLDKNTTPDNTIYYLSGIVHGIIKRYTQLEYLKLYDILCKRQNRKISFDYYTLALDFLFLLNKVAVDDNGVIFYVY